MKPTCKPWSEPWSEASVVVLPHWFVTLVWTTLALVTFTSLKRDGFKKELTRFRDEPI